MERLNSMSKSFYRKVGFGLGLKKKDLYEGRDLLSTLDARCVYLSAMAVCFNIDSELLQREVFWGENLPDLSTSLFKT